MAVQVQKTLDSLIEPVVTGLGYELVGIEYLPQGRHSVLRIYIDSGQGIQLEDCERVSRQVSGVLDVEEPLTGQYVLEVSSPGLDRPLFKAEHYARFIGHPVRIRLRQAVDGQKKFRGVLQAVEVEHIVLLEAESDREVELALANIDKANLEPEF